jgi:hypothetical protein
MWWKSFPNWPRFIVLVAIIAVSGTLLALSMSSLFAARKGVGGCSSPGKTVVVTFQHDRLDPKTVAAQQCDTLAIRNLDDHPHEPALGAHDHHADYPGFDALVVPKSGEVRVQLIRTGTYRLHDHLNDDIATVLVVE